MDIGSSGMVTLLRRGNFQKLFVGQAISGLGDWVATFGFIALVYDLTKSTDYVAWILIVRLVPPLFAAPFGGILADRLPRRTVMISLDIARAVLIAIVPFVNVWFVFVLALAHEFGAFFFFPARDASVPSLVPRKLLTPANGLILASSYGTLPIAGAVFSTIHNSSFLVPDWLPGSHFIDQRPVTLVFFLDSVTFLISAYLIYRMTIPHKALKTDQPSVRRELWEGVRYVWTNPTIRLLSIGILMAMFGGGVLFAVGIAYVRQTLGGSDATFGWLASLWGAGMGLGLLVVRKLINWRGSSFIFVSAIAFCGGLLLGMALVSKVFLAFALAVPFGMSFAVAITLAMSIAQATAEESLRGRTLGSLQMLYRLGLASGALIMGAVAHEINGIDIGIKLDGNQLSMLVSGLLILGAAGVASPMLKLPKKSRISL